MSGTISLIIAALGIAARYEPIVAAALGALIPALRELHAKHGDAVLIGDIDRLFHQHQLDPNVVAQVIPIDVAVGNTPGQI